MMYAALAIVSAILTYRVLAWFDRERQALDDLDNAE